MDPITIHVALKWSYNCVIAQFIAHNSIHTSQYTCIYIYIYCEVFGYLNIYIFFCDPNSCLGHPFGFTTYWVRNFDLPLGLLEAHPRCLSLPQCSALRYQLWSVVFAEENARVMHEHENKRYACCKTKKKHVVCRCMMEFEKKG